MGVYSRLIGAETEPGNGAPAEAEDGQRPDTRLSGVVTGVGRRVDEILETAARIADEIRSDAEAQGAAYLDERRAEADRMAEERRAEGDRIVEQRRRDVGEITEALAAKVERVEREVSDLVAALRDATQALGAEAASPAPVSLVKDPDQSAAPDSGVDERALLRATQMAVAGADRNEIESVLREQYGLADPAPLVDKLLSGDRG